MRLTSLSLKDKEKFDRYLALRKHELSVYNFANIFIWRGLFDISYSVIEGGLCVFFKDKIGAFLYLAPLGGKMSASQTEEAFKILDRINKNKDISRIENIEEKDLASYRASGYDCRLKSHDYICQRQELAFLRGDSFKSKRASANYFIKHYGYEYLPFSLKERASCLKLYEDWAAQRKDKNSDKIYQGMLEDSRQALLAMLDNYKALGLTGRIIKIGRAVKGFTFGFKLNKDTFCILYEITDLSLKGLAQFIFRQFAAELKECRYINIMDDSGLENLKKVKLSYHPVRLAPAYIVTRR